MRKFPAAEFIYRDESGAAIDAVRFEKPDVVVLHRTLEDTAVSLVTAIRAADAAVPIIVLSAVDRSEGVLAAGATGFLNIDQWLLLGNVVANALASAPVHGK